MPGPLVSLTTDFGAGVYVAQLKAVILAAAPAVQLVDAAHDLPAHAIAAAELVLRSIAFSFPEGSVHLVVVDPGVGTARRPIAVAARDRFFVGPDNGVLGIAVAAKDARIVELTNQALFRRPVSRTFHGRDIFAPVAAALANGRTLDEVGTPISDPSATTLPAASWSPGTARGETLGADRFGNLHTNLPMVTSSARLADFVVSVDGERVEWYPTYGDAPPGALFALEGSDGFLELAVREGSAAALLGTERGTSIDCAAAAREP